LGFIDNDQVLEEDVMAMATMILGGFTEKGCRVVVTTHDPSVLRAIVNMEAAIVFGKKTVDEGPASYEFVEGIEEIDSSEYGRRATALCGKLFA